MERADAWLTVTFAAGSDIEPPPLPNIPADYLAKPRRKRPTSALLPSSHPRIISLPKRKHTTLAEIDLPNEPLPSPTEEPSPSRSKRQRVVRIPNMRHQSQSPSKQKYPARNKAQAGENAFDLDAAPRRPRRTNPRPAKVLSETVMPRLTPGVSEGENEDWNQPDSSVTESADSRTSKRSVSPTKRMVDLRVADKRVLQKSVRSQSDVPRDVQELYRKVLSLTTFARSIIPKGIEVRVLFNFVHPLTHI
ncbi:hypothetical protein M501DRAFT_462650 [Patellaria atrata CBS 101060]|uniref:Uncharacterized protein n=1 Tax=Patellaria atrata CBS 101060 TaxID=1346257 RepID=A0A9P4S538_9PEZI|nr:hypothetical protein M501DRAFT_462650 [Patellaria atrata CBS 101060]